jgi:hypothetical protein
VEYRLLLNRIYLQGARPVMDQRIVTPANVPLIVAEAKLSLAHDALSEADITLYLTVNQLAVMHGLTPFWRR